MTNLARVLDAVSQWCSGDFCGLMDTVFSKNSDTESSNSEPEVAQCDYCEGSPSTSTSICSVFRTAHMMEQPSTSATEAPVEVKPEERRTWSFEYVLCCCKKKKVQPEPETVVYRGNRDLRSRPPTPGIALNGAQERYEQDYNSLEEEERNHNRSPTVEFRNANYPHITLEITEEEIEERKRAIEHSSSERHRPFHIPSVSRRVDQREIEQRRNSEESKFDRSSNRPSPSTQLNVPTREQQEDDVDSNRLFRKRNVPRAATPGVALFRHPAPEREEQDERPAVHASPSTSYNARPRAGRERYRSEPTSSAQQKPSSPPPLREIPEDELGIYEDDGPPTEHELRRSKTMQRQDAVARSASESIPSSSSSGRGLPLNPRTAKSYFSDSEHVDMNNSFYHAQIEAPHVTDPDDSIESQDWLEVLENDYSDNNTFDLFTF